MCLAATNKSSGAISLLKIQFLRCHMANSPTKPRRNRFKRIDDIEAILDEEEGEGKKASHKKEKKKKEKKEEKKEEEKK
jgi:hypothetical protein